jgi:hypothetical protein
MALAGCTGDSSPGPEASATTSAPTTSPTRTLSPGQQLRALAGAATDTAFRAIYRVHRAEPGSSAMMRVDHTAKSVRVDITAGATTATLIATPPATYACTRKHKHRACFRVAKRGDRIPRPFNLAPASIFTTDVARLSDHPHKYDVESAGERQAQGDVPASTCFRVRATTGSKKDRRPVTYCFSDKGVLVYARYASGNVIRLQALRMHVDPNAFKPYSSPTPLPN